MLYYSTNNQIKNVALSDVVIKGLADDNGLFMPDYIPVIPAMYYQNIEKQAFRDLAYTVAYMLFGEDVHANMLKMMVNDTLSFDVPLVKVTDRIFSLELFHGPTLAFKDVGARFMSRMLSYFIQRQDDRRDVNVLVATSGDTGSAVANGFLGIEGIHVYVLYPKGQVSKVQESQFTTLGQNITALEVDGSFDDCQALVKAAFMDEELNKAMMLTSANSINVARFLPQAFYYFQAYAELKKISAEAAANMVICVPSGNFGNLTAGLVAKRMGLPVKRFIAANNSNDIFLQYLQTGEYTPRPSVPTIANAMDVGNPSNFARILDLFRQSHGAITAEISGFSYTDEAISNTIRECRAQTGYLLDPHGACGYQALKDNLKEGEYGVFLETAHPAKFNETVEHVLGEKVELPEKLQEFLKGQKQTIELAADFSAFKSYLLKKA
jgi:threonine synthase